MRDLVLVMVFGIVTFPTFVLPHIGVLVWVWMAIMNPHRESYGFSLTLPFNMMIAVLTLGAWLFSRESKRIPLNPVTVFLVLFTISMIVSTFTALRPDYSYDLLDRNLKTMLLTFAIMGLFQTKVRIHALVWILALSIAYWSTRGALFMVATGGGFKLFGPEKSMIHDNNHVACAFLMMFPLLNYLRLQSQVKIVRIGLTGALALTVLAVLGSYSRGAFIGLAAMLPFFWWRSKAKVLSLVVLSGLAMGALAAMPDKFFDRMNTIKTADEDSSFNARLEAWQAAINIARERPLVGAGFRATEIPEIFSRYNPESTERHGRAIHSIYFQALADQGFVGLGLFLLIGFFSWRNARYIIRSTKGVPELRWAHDLASMVTVSFVAYAVAGAALSLAYYDYYYCLVAVLVVVRDLVTRELEARSPAPTAGQALYRPAPSPAR
jgi:probable O-glycosylation ligase (exosortase A-associated)